MSLHRITAGSGYDYLTRQVAAQDTTERGHVGLSSYYTEKGEVPGRWVGSGMVGIDGLKVGDVVTADQMQSLFGSGHHPLAAQRAAALANDPNATEQDVLDAIRLGQPFHVYAGDISPYRVEVARRLEALNVGNGRAREAANSIEDRARIRTEVGREFFQTEFGRAPLDARELAGHIARLSRQKTTAVAGFDLTFSPVKSVSALWALAEPSVAAAIERAHQAAVGDALTFIEQRVLFTRTGAKGVRQVEVRGLVGAAFTHRDSRAGDPDLHTHVAVANKVQTVEDGRWLSVDSRVLHKAITAASETYNTALEARLTDTLGVRFEPREGGDPRKRPVREIVGLEPKLLDRWSSRRQRIVERQAELAAIFQLDHGRPPTPVEAIALAQQATLETREGKHAPRSLAQQRETWHSQAVEVLHSEHAVRTMLRKALHPTHAERDPLDRDWFDKAARQIVARVEQDRSAWQVWHIRAEALRVVRASNVPAASIAAVVDWLTRDVLDRHSVPLTPDRDGIAEPDPLRRSDGASVYTVAGSRLFTSTRILAAEQRLVAKAGIYNGRIVPDTAVDLALLETAANGTKLNAGQILLVRAMATSGARVQLAIAPAGSGKTTAMHALSCAWINGGGSVLGLAPSAVAAAGLGEQIGGHADTLAKLAWHIQHGSAPQWMKQIGPASLVIIDEAGMADTLSLDTVVGHVLKQGGSVRLIGDDQQLGAIGAGGVLRDIKATHGALQLNELVRFTDPAEGSASLALREGRPEALGFYLDRRRVQIGNPDTMTDALFTAWAADRATGRDSVMLAPTHDLVADLNQRARIHRLNGQNPGREAQLADDNMASVGDVIITRRNNRKLRISATDWVKNGDRWTVQAITLRGLRVRHTRSGRHILLPKDYVAEWTELGYACTTHTAQGVTADTCHGLLTGDETRQQTYTMLTRGRRSNHAYLITVGDGDPHSLIHPETINPATAIDQLEHILIRDESPTSATTTLRHANDPAVLLGDATGRYRDAITFAAGHTTDPADRHTIQFAAERLIPGVTQVDAWPALLAQLLVIAADNRDPIVALHRAADQPLAAGRDPAAVLAWRLDDTQPGQAPGPLPWLNPVPANLSQHPLWGPYLAAREERVGALAEQVRAAAETISVRPPWSTDGACPPVSLIADIDVWRSANQIPATDLRPVGEPEHGGAAGRWQQHLDRRLASVNTAPLNEWAPLLRSLDRQLTRDPFVNTLASRIAQLYSAGIDVQTLLRHAANEGPLPYDRAAAALWWRISGHITPAVSHETDPLHHLAANWLPPLRQAVGEPTATEMAASTWWPTLVATIEQAIQRGWTLDNVIAQAPTHHDGMLDITQAWVWRLSLAADPIPFEEDEPGHPDDQDPHDLFVWTSRGNPIGTAAANEVVPPMAEPPDEDEFEVVDPDAEAEIILAIEALVRASMGSPEPTAAEIRHQQDHADAWRACTYTPEQLAHINDLATQFYEARLAGSWAQPYLVDRLRQDITGHATFRPGFAPEGWTALVQHLHRIGITDDEMLTAGLATKATTGRLIDRFRDRLVFPITHHGQVLGFIARRNPAFSDDDGHGPKYLNTAETPLFHKGDQLFTTGDFEHGTAVLVEGPLDAIATTLASGSRHVGVAPLGTSLSDAQADQLRAADRVVVATDADTPGRAAAERDFWLAAIHSVNTSYAPLPDGRDPADLVACGSGQELSARVTAAGSLAMNLIDRILDADTSAQGILQAVQVLAAASPNHWSEGAALISARTAAPTSLVRSSLSSFVRAFNADPRVGAATARERSSANEQDLRRQRPLAGQRHDQAGLAHRREAGRALGPDR